MVGGPTMIAGGGGGSTLYHGSGRYKSGDSMMYHGSMFLKRLSDVHGDKSNEHEQHGWRDKLGHFLESKPEQWFIFALICIDLLIIFVQLFVIDPHISCEHHPDPHPDPSPTPPPHYETATTTIGYFMFNSEHSSHGNEPEDPYERADKWLKLGSVGILVVLALEIVLLLVAFDVRFFKQPLYILDALVIGASLAIELLEDKAAAFANLLMIFRLWRIVRIIHGIAMSVQERSEEQIKELEAELEKVNKEKTHLETKFDYLKKKYKKLADAHEEAHFKNVVDNEELMGNTPRPNSLPVFQSPGAPHLEGIANDKLNKKKIRMANDVRDDDGDDDDEEAISAEVAAEIDSDSRHKSITINADESDARDVRRPLVDRNAARGVQHNNEYNTFNKNRHNR